MLLMLKFIHLNQLGGNKLFKRIKGLITLGLTEIFVIIKGTVIYACIDNRQTLIRRNYDNAGERLFLFAKDGDVTFEEIKVRPLVNQQ